MSRTWGQVGLTISNNDGSRFHTGPAAGGGDMSSTNVMSRQAPGSADGARPAAERDVDRRTSGINVGQAEGAKLIYGGGRPTELERGFFVQPTIFTGVTNDMTIARTEFFGPVGVVISFSTDDEAVRLANDSDFGLTAAVWTRDLEAALSIGDRLETGTVFMNRCDYLDPALAWTGVKDSGRGVSLSRLAYEHLTRPKSFHLRHGG